MLGWEVVYYSGTKEYFGSNAVVMRCNPELESRGGEAGTKYKYNQEMLGRDCAAGPQDKLSIGRPPTILGKPRASPTDDDTRHAWMDP